MRPRHIAIVACLLAVATAASGKEGPSPAFGVPQSLAGELRATDTGQLPAPRDSSSFSEFSQSYYSMKLPVGLDVSAGFGFGATNWGMQLWDLTTDPAHPSPLGYVGYPFPYNATGEDGKVPVHAVSVPSGMDSIAALACTGGMGLVIVDTSVKAAPRVLYQDGGSKSGNDVYTAHIGNRTFAFFPSLEPQATYVYDLDEAAKNTGAPYVEDAPKAGSLFPDVFLGAHFDGLTVAGTNGPLPKAVNRIHGVNQYVVTAGMYGGFDIWDATDPTAPVHLGGGGGNAAVLGVVMWAAGGRYYVAAHLAACFLAATQPYEIDFFDVTPIVTKAKTTADAPLATVVPPGVTSPSSDVTRLLMSHADDGTPFVWFTSGGEYTHDATALDQQAEELYDVSIPSAPRAVTPPAKTIDGAETSYWGATYQYGWVAPRAGRVYGNHLYRVANSIFDVHEWSSPHPMGSDAGVPTGGGADAGPSQTADAGPPATADAGAQAGCACTAAGTSRRPSSPLVACVALALVCTLRRYWSDEAARSRRRTLRD